MEEEMWCFNCEHTWITKDYHNCNECPNCKKKPIRIYRQSSTSYVYAYFEKHPEHRPENQNIISSKKKSKKN